MDISERNFIVSKGSPASGNLNKFSELKFSKNVSKELKAMVCVFKRVISKSLEHLLHFVFHYTQRLPLFTL